MLNNDIKMLVESKKSQRLRNDYIINSIKEFLQMRILYFLYSNKKYNDKLIFTGGTCLRFCFNLPRLSEDLDFDFVTNIDHKILSNDIYNFLKRHISIEQLETVIKGKNKKIYFKLPILKELNLSYNNSNILYIKVEASPVTISSEKVEVTAISRDGFYFYLKRYSLADLMSGKICAFLTRAFFKGKKNEVDFKGRDLFDLVWYMGQNIVPNKERLKKGLSDADYKYDKWEELLKQIQNKINTIKKQHLIMDLSQFIEDHNLLSNFLENYIKISGQYVENQRKNVGIFHEGTVLGISPIKN